MYALDHLSSAYTMVLSVARLVSDTLSRNRDNPNFEVSILTCSITYM